MSLDLALTVSLIGLMIIGIGYAVVINRRFRLLQKNEDKLEKLAATFGEATLRADQSIGRLKTMAEELSDSIDKAQSLRDDLAFLIERGGSAADRLEASVRTARKQAAAEQTPSSEKESAGVRRTKPEPKKEPARTDTEAERELLNALRSAR